MEGREELIACPALFTLGEGDRLAATARPFFEKLRCLREFLAFTAGEGADGHCEMKNRSLLHLRVLDGVFADQP